MRSQQIVGLIESDANSKQSEGHLHYADPVLYFTGGGSPRVGRGKALMVDSVTVGHCYLDEFRVVWGSDPDAVCEVLSTGYPRTVFVTGKKTHKKVKAKIKSLGAAAQEVGMDFKGVGRLVMQDGSCKLQVLKNMEWCTPDVSKPKAKTKPRGKE